MPFSRHLRHVAHDALQAQHALTDTRQLIAGDSHRIDAGAQYPGERFTARRRPALRSKHFGGDGGEVGAHFLQHIGDEINHGIDQHGEHPGTVHAHAFLDLLPDLGECVQLRVTHGDELVSRENEA